MIKICKYCNNKFNTNKNVDHCSNEDCKRKYHKEKSFEDRICPICNTVFNVRKSKPKIYCSKKCAQSATEVKEKIVKSQNITYSKKYGMHPMKLQSTLENHKKSMLEKYGVEYALQSPVLKQKMKDNNFKKYGVEYVLESEDIMQKCKETFKRKYENGEYNTIYSDAKIKQNYYKLIDNLNEKNIIPLFSENDYIGYKYENKYPLECSICHYKFQSAIYNLNNVFCEVCHPFGRNRDENTVFYFLNQLCKDTIIIRRDRTVMNGKELDFYLPNKKIAIEYNGLYWHSENTGRKTKNYHLNKTVECENKDIRLLQIFENEWKEKSDIVKSILKNYLHKIENRIYARKCEIKEIDSVISNMFLNENHLQGKDNAPIRIGLFYNNDLVSVMTFSKPRFNKKYEWEMSRFCNKINFSIIGSANKLFTYFLRNYNPTSIISYANRRYFDGKIYEKLNFKFDGYTDPNYYYLNNHAIFNRIQFQKHKLKNKLTIYNERLSEWENMQLNGYDRIWDCGNKKFIWKK